MPAGRRKDFKMKKHLFATTLKQLVSRHRDDCRRMILSQLGINPNGDKAYIQHELSSQGCTIVIYSTEPEIVFNRHIISIHENVCALKDGKIIKSQPIIIGIEMMCDLVSSIYYH